MSGSRFVCTRPRYPPRLDCLADAGSIRLWRLRRQVRASGRRSVTTTSDSRTPLGGASDALEKLKAEVLATIRHHAQHASDLKFRTMCSAWLEKYDPDYLCPVPPPVSTPGSGPAETREVPSSARAVSRKVSARSSTARTRLRRNFDRMAHHARRPTTHRGPRWWKDHTPRSTIADVPLCLTARDARALLQSGEDYRLRGVLAPSGEGTLYYAVTVERQYSPSRLALCLQSTDPVRGRMFQVTARAGPPLVAVDIDWSRCRFGGVRYWLRCPQCDRRRTAVYTLGAVDALACRVCLGLAYSSQRQTPRTRRRTRASRIAERLGIDLAAWSRASKPPRMHRRTYQRLLAVLDRECRDARSELKSSRVPPLGRSRHGRTGR